MTCSSLAFDVAPSTEPESRPDLAPHRFGASPADTLGALTRVIEDVVDRIVPGTADLVADEQKALLDVFNGQIAIAGKDLGPLGGIVAAGITNLRDLVASKLGIATD